jgi:hypothetical protein
VQPLLAVGRGLYAEALRAEEALHQLPYSRVIVDDEHGAGTFRRPAVVYLGAALGFRRGWRAERRNLGRQAHHEGRTFPQLALHADVTAHEPAQAPGDRQAQAGAAVLAGRGGIRLGEVLEQLAHLLGRQADAAVTNPEGQPVVAVHRLAHGRQGDRAL